VGSDEHDGWSPPKEVPLRGVKPTVPRKLLTRTEVAELRALAVTDQDRRVLDAYETAVRLLEGVVREDRQSRPPLDATDVAWLALREAER
jgi:hypothetical protein